MKTANTERFERVKAYLEQLTSWVAIDREASSVVVDTGELELQLRDYETHLDELLAIPPMPENREPISTKLADLWASVGSIKMVCDDVHEPLSRLLSAMSDGEDEGEALSETDR